MKYIKVEWHHDLPTEPTLLYSELSDDLWEIRKVELYADGHIGYASKTETAGGSNLSIEPIPLIFNINKDSQFSAIEINENEFEEIWDKSHVQSTHEYS